jgi:ribosomal protein S12 methylthiotransferase accessory factor
VQDRVQYTTTDLAGAFGAVGWLRPTRTSGSLPGYTIHTSTLGDLSALPMDSRREAYQSQAGTGRTYLDLERSRVLAVGEALERYAEVTVEDGMQLSSSASALGDRAMDLDLVARCSKRELSHPGCPLTVPDKTEPIRWLPAVDMHTGSVRLVPAVMSCLCLYPSPAERFWTPISTGGAAHTSLEAAVVSGICEVIERDALSLTWLQKLPLPRLGDACLSDEARDVIRWCAEHGIDTHLFDATTDVGVPTVYCLQTTRDPAIDRMAQVVACATNFDPATAALRAVLEAIGIRIGLVGTTDHPRRYQDFTSVTHGALVMGRRSRRRAFGFLLDEPRPRAASIPQAVSCESDTDKLGFLLERLARRGMSVYVVDLTRRELEAADLVAVQVIIPELQPMSVRPLAQYRGHRRLYEAPARMGMRVLPEHQLNPNPQPMA